ncbi:ribonucleotide-diphosphate reductase subunit alpha [Chloriridovirus anopheles1]|uniref:Ribonucleotide-diphosphate reductase subunit alpha n=1 Tax=Chloriridovirus anopheles1 TaxID=1465751 RepID=W8R9R3_9VIRU|nr:ribonucleotide-diphosphate reductase subunit alpha [Anopheles minimus iridovirus]AHL67596.1 ribonucleotide-diphosphate reductase subunit alpha [Anopheles minimus iridovirus]
MLNKVLKVDTAKLVDFHVPDVHCDGIIDRILSPEELVKLHQSNKSLYTQLVGCGYTRTVGLLHAFALWSSMSKTKDMKSFQHFMDCVKKVEWKDPALFVDFHTPKSKIGKCII